MADRIDILVSARNAASPVLRAVAQDTGKLAPAAQQSSGALAQLRAAAQGLQGAYGALLALPVVATLISQGQAAAQAALQYDQASRTARLLAGDVARYSEVLAVARSNQDTFGGSLITNVQGLASLAAQARKSGIALADLNDLSQRLNLLSPEQGLEGASIALREALGGELTSLAERFELPRSELRKLADQSLSAADRAKILSQILEGQGLAAGSAADAASQTARAYNELSGALERAKIGFGTLIAQGFEPAARGAGRIVNALSGERAALDEARLSALSYANDALGPLAPLQLQIAEATTRATLAQQANAGATQQATDAAVAQTDALQKLNAAKILEDAQSAALAARQAELARVAQELASGQRTNADAAAILAQQFGITQEEAEKLIDGLRTLASQAPETGTAVLVMGGAAIKSAALVGALTNEMNAASNAALRLAGNAGKAFGAAAGVAAGAGASRENFAASVGARRDQQFALGSDSDRLAILQRELSRLDAGSAAYIQKQTEIAQLERSIAADRQRTAEQAANSRKQLAEQQARETEALRQAQLQNELAEASPAERLAIYERELAKTRKGTVEYEKALGDVRKAQESIRKEQEKEIEETRRKYEQLRRLSEDYRLSESRSTEDFERQKRRLLAEGRIKEAQLLEEEFRIKQRRAAEDFAVAQQRQREQGGIANSTVVPGTVPGTPNGAPPPQATGVPPRNAAGTAAPVAPPPMGTGQTVVVQVQAVVNLDGQKVGDLLFTRLEQRLDDNLTIAIEGVNIVAPPGGGQGAGVAGPRP